MNSKRTFYIVVATLLGMILSFLVHALIEIWYLKSVEPTIIDWTSPLGNGLCALPIWLQIGLFLVGAIGGFFLSRYWWRVVYVEKRHWRFKKDKD